MQDLLDYQWAIQFCINESKKSHRLDEISIEEATSTSVEKKSYVLTVIVLAQGSALELVMQLERLLVLELVLESAFESELELALL